ncbi:Cd(II)/Pb(II)-responsive transcriptional regulator [Chitinolyticbacter albus]|uniref:Cd(II)/Pb(II)-responsive transcriptional regulator n=1 Tax=Chitinolyticbacter albus TaxID=2961951 RepID=UPI00210B7426|nr:Cd(II)/Pb(II)-responsive transcriptional regulator [Chitinolyticbacter albus]
MKIGEVAKAAQCSVETIRYYEREGLLPLAARTASNYRAYGTEHLDRLRFIRNCRALDMTHGEIRLLLDTMAEAAPSCGGIDQVIDAHIDHVVLRISELQQLKTQLLALRQRCQRDSTLDQCGILQGLAEMDEDARSVVRHTHLG